MPQPGFSADGYIIDQDCFTAYPYRGCTSNINGCGWVAAFDLLKAQGHILPFETVLNGMNSISPTKIPSPTPMRVLRKYLSAFGCYRLWYGRKASLHAASRAPAGILRYWEGPEPHYIPFLRLPDGQYRFLNVADGMEDITAPISDFFATHCRRGLVRVLVPG